MIGLNAIYYFSELALHVNRNTFGEKKSYDKFLCFSLTNLEMTVMQKTFTLEAIVRLGAVFMEHHREGHSVINMIETPELSSDPTLVSDITLTSSVSEDSASNQYLFTVKYRNVS